MSAAGSGVQKKKKDKQQAAPAQPIAEESKKPIQQASAPAKEAPPTGGDVAENPATFERIKAKLDEMSIPY